MNTGPTNRQHVAHAAALAAPPKHTCHICSGPSDRGGIHELCRLRKRDGRPTPRIDSREPCRCWNCTKGGAS